MPTWPSPRSEQLGTPNPPRNPFHAGHVFRGFPVHAFATACQVARPPVRIRPICSASEGFYFQASNGSVALPVGGYTDSSGWTRLLAGLAPAGMAASLAAPEPYVRLSRIRLPPRVCDGKVAVYAPAPLSREPASEPSTCFAGAYSPWPPPFAPPTPLRPPPQMPPQWASFALFAGFTATMAGSDFSRPCIIGFGSSPSRCGPSLSRNA